MVRKSLLVITLLAIAAPLAAQDELVWSSKRPDAQAPFGVVGGQLLGRGEFQVSYRFSQLASKGLWADADSISLETALEYYHWVPRHLTAMEHRVGVAFAPTDALTLMATMGYQQREREQYSDDGILTVASFDDLADLEVTGLYGVYDEGAYRAHVQLGVTIPTGPTEARSPDGSALSYDMRTGSGVFALSPGVTMATQNESGSVGTQIKGTFHLGTNDLGFAEGDRFELNVWGSYRANRFFSVSGRLAYQNWQRIEGADPELASLNTTWLDTYGKGYDPAFEGYFLGGSRLDIPVGVNLFMPEGSLLAGQRFSLEYIFPVSRKYDGPQVGSEWGLVAGWQVVF